MKKNISRNLVIVLSLLFIFVFILSSCDALSFRSIKSAEINKSGELILSYTDGTYQNLGTVKGEDGKDGKDGINGKDGIDGDDGTTTIIGDSGDDSLATSKALNSAVSVFCSFNVSTGASITTTSSAGAGIIYKCNKETGDAYVITNYHVVYEKSSIDSQISSDISIFLYGSEFSEMKIPATYIGGSMNYDIAVLKITNNDIIKKSDVSAVSVRSSSQIHVGESAIAVGNPEAEGISATKGIISRDSENITISVDGTTSVDMRVMRIDTPVNSGNSGGGLFDSNGNLIGIVNAKLKDTSVENIGYAIPSDIVTAVAKNIIYYCDGVTCTTMQRPLLGISVSINDSYAEYDEATGYVNIIETVIVYGVNTDSVAYGKLKVDDIIKSVTIGERTIEITRQFSLIDSLLNARIGDTILLTIERNGETKELSFTITEDMISSY